MEAVHWLLLVKSLHIISSVAWLGGLFYLGRIFVYHAEAMDRPPAESAILIPQLSLMEERAYRIISNPAMMFTWVMGLVVLHLHGYDWFKVNVWMHIKLLLLVLLTVYHVLCKKYMLKLKDGQLPMSSFNFRLFNEVPTLLLVGIVLLAVYRNTLHFGIAFLSIILLGVVFYFFAKAYRRMRKAT